MPTVTGKSSVTGKPYVTGFFTPPKKNESLFNKFTSFFKKKEESEQSKRITALQKSNALSEDLLKGDRNRSSYAFKGKKEFKAYPDNNLMFLKLNLLCKENIQKIECLSNQFSLKIQSAISIIESCKSFEDQEKKLSGKTSQELIDLIVLLEKNPEKTIQDLENIDDIENYQQIEFEMNTLASKLITSFTIDPILNTPNLDYSKILFINNLLPKYLRPSFEKKIPWTLPLKGPAQLERFVDSNFSRKNFRCLDSNSFPSWYERFGPSGYYQKFGSSDYYQRPNFNDDGKLEKCILMVEKIIKGPANRFDQIKSSVKQSGKEFVDNIVDPYGTRHRPRSVSNISYY